MASTSNAQASVAFLSAADDLLTKLLLDYSIFHEPRLNGRATGKMIRFARELRMSDKEVDAVRELVDQLRQGLVSVHDGLDTLLSLSAVKTFCQKWKDEPLFAHHAKRYILALRPDSGIAFHETDRYKNPRGLHKSRTMAPTVAAKLRRDPATFIEVGVFATRAFKKGEVINLRGGIADLTEEEDDEMRDEGGRSDFSVLWSQRKECFCLLLGPARFVNHDCRNNVEFQLVGTNMTFRVLEDIAKDEEVFTHYGEHYFDRDNASCLCATCEQLKQGAFAPARPRAVTSARPRAPSPTPASRRSRRASSIAAPDYNEARASASRDGPSPVVVPRAGRGAGLTRSASTSALSARSPGRPRPRCSRMNPARGELPPADALRGQPRLIVQPKLPPPPGYASDYSWDAKRRIACYIGPKVSSVAENARTATKVRHPRRSLSTASVVTLGKRRRSAAATATASESSPAPAASSPRAVKRPRTSQVKLKPVRLGERRSQRTAGGAGTLSDKDREFAELREAMHGADDAAGSSELSETEVDAVEAEEVEVTLPPPKEASVPADRDRPAHQREGSSASVVLSVGPSRLTRSLTSETTVSRVTPTIASRAVTCDITMSTSTPIEEETQSPQLRSTSEEEEHEDHVILCHVPSDLEADRALGSSSPRKPIMAPLSRFYAAAVDSGGGGGGELAGSSVSKATQQQSDFRNGPTSGGGDRNASGSAAGALGGSNGVGAGAGGGGGGDDEDDRRERKRSLPFDKVAGDEGEEDKPRLGKETQTPGKDAANASVDEVHAMTSGMGAEQGGTSGLPSDPEDAAAALLMLLCAAPQAHTPSSTAPTPPYADSSGPSASTSASGEASSSTRARNMGKGRVSDESRASPGPSLNPRSTRRHSKLTASPVPEPVAAVSASKGKKKVRISDAIPALATSDRRRSITRSGGPSAVAGLRDVPSPSIEARRTRSQPLPGKLEDVLYAPETLAATGGYDWEKGRYISKFEAVRDPSHNPLPPRRPTPTPSPPPAPVRKPSRPASHPPVRASIKAPTQTPTEAPLTQTPAKARTDPRTHTPPLHASAPNVARPARASLNPGELHATTALPSTASGPPEGVRSTRRSFPIAGPLRDLIYSPAIVAANGGWDAAAGKYVSAANASAQASAPPAPSRRRASSASVNELATASTSRKRPASPAIAPASSSAPPADVRSTRRSFPMANTKLSDLVYSPAARLVSGGWDPVSGKYVSAAKGDVPLASPAAAAPPSSR